jgi:hypothetical protein
MEFLTDPRQVNFEIKMIWVAHALEVEADCFISVYYKYHIRLIVENIDGVFV